MQKELKYEKSAKVQVTYVMFRARVHTHHKHYDSSSVLLSAYCQGVTIKYL